MRNKLINITTLRIFFIAILIILGILTIFSSRHTETNILKAIFSTNQDNLLVDLSTRFSSKINVVVESNTSEKAEIGAKTFYTKLDKTKIHSSEIKANEIISNYEKYHNNLLSNKTRKLLMDKDYNTVMVNSYIALYNPTTPPIGSVEQDPFLFLADFVTNLSENFQTPTNFTTIQHNGKFYNLIMLDVDDKLALSPTVLNTEIKKVIDLQNELSKDGVKIYLAGAPIHSYFASSHSIFEINLICILSTLFVTGLIFWYFGSLLPLIPVAVSIWLGIYAGYCMTALIFKDIHILTFVFSTTLIGVCVDYSLHYFVALKEGKNGTDAIREIFKSLTVSLITTVSAFLILLFADFVLLRQISVFTITGLLTVYGVVVLWYPVLDKAKQPACEIVCFLYAKILERKTKLLCRIKAKISKCKVARFVSYKVSGLLRRCGINWVGLVPDSENVIDAQMLKCKDAQSITNENTLKSGCPKDITTSLEKILRKYTRFSTRVLRAIFNNHILPKIHILQKQLKRQLRKIVWLYKRKIKSVVKKYYQNAKTYLKTKYDKFAKIIAEENMLFHLPEKDENIVETDDIDEIRYSEENDNLTPNNLMKNNQSDFSPVAQNDDFVANSAASLHSRPAAFVADHTSWPLGVLTSNLIKTAFSRFTSRFSFLGCLAALFLIFGLSHIHFDDNIKNMYTPPKNLLQAEKLFSEVAGTNTDTSIFVVKGKNLEEILQKEENITDNLNSDNCRGYQALSKFVPSEKRQKSNQILRKELYDAKLNEYAVFLPPQTRAKLIRQDFGNEFLNANKNFEFLKKNFLIYEDTSIMVVFGYKGQAINGVRIINFQKDISTQIRHCRKICLALLIPIFGFLYLLLAKIYDFKSAVKILAPSVCAVVFVFAILGFFGCAINLFHLLAIFLIIGFGLDYSVFRFTNPEKSGDSVFLSCITTVFSFALLAFTGFKLISSLGTVLALGLLSSYIFSIKLISRKGSICTGKTNLKGNQ